MVVAERLASPMVARPQFGSRAIAGWQPPDLAIVRAMLRPPLMRRAMAGQPVPAFRSD